MPVDNLADSDIPDTLPRSSLHGINIRITNSNPTNEYVDTPYQQNLVLPEHPSKIKTLCRTIGRSPSFKRLKIAVIIVYYLNIVAWGAMLFLVLVGAANKTMPDEQTRKAWIEIDSQILNALFCVTGIGFIPWRVRDLYQFHCSSKIYKVRDRHSYTGSKVWIGVVIWLRIANSLFQIGMALCMWTMGMDSRPGWLVGVFVGLGCATAVAEGLIRLILGKRNKSNNHVVANS